MKVVAFCLLHTKLIWHQRYSQLWHRAVWQICTNISRVPAISIIRLMEAAGSSQTMLHNYRLTVAGPRWQATSFSPLWESQISFYMILNKSRPKSDWYETVNSGLCMWVIWLSGCLYKSEGVVCLSSSELLTTVTCLSCWDVSGL